MDSSEPTGPPRNREAILGELFAALPQEPDALVRELQQIRRGFQSRLAATLAPAVNDRLRVGMQGRFTLFKHAALWVDQTVTSLGLCLAFPGKRQPAVVNATRLQDGTPQMMLFADLGQPEFSRVPLPPDPRVELIAAPVHLGELEGRRQHTMMRAR